MVAIQLANAPKSVKGDRAYFVESAAMENVKIGTIAIKGGSTDDVRTLKTEVSLPPETISATAVINNRNIELTKNTAGDSWSGVAVINADEEKEIFSPLVPATLLVKDINNEVNIYQLDWSEVTPIKTSIWEKYKVFRNNPNNDMLPVLIFGNFYFKVLLVIFSLAAILNIFVQIKQQKWELILGSFGIISLLTIFILF